MKRTHGSKRGDIEIKLDFDSQNFQPISSSNLIQSTAPALAKAESELESNSVLEHLYNSQVYFAHMNHGNLSSSTETVKDPLEHNSKKKRRKQNLNQRNYF